MALLEVACFNPDHAILAWKAGADRIELCDNRQAGGTTPPLDWVKAVKSEVHIPLFTMIRPRPGDFTYSTKEFAQMRAEIESLKSYADGFVFGILDPAHRVDKPRTAELVRLAHPLPCTFHRAFDETRNPFDAFEDVVKAGCSAILTSGGAASASAGTAMIARLVHMAKDRPVTIIPGGSLRSKNAALIRGHTRATVFHSSAVVKGSEEPSAEEIRQLKACLQDPSICLSPLQSPASAETDEGMDSEPLEMQMSAVSIGATPPDT
jgi:copper homeostasis protein